MAALRVHAPQIFPDVILFEYFQSTHYYVFVCIFDYVFSDTRHCFRYLKFWGRFNHFVFIGDSRVRQLYYSFVGKYILILSFSFKRIIGFNEDFCSTRQGER